jgi:Cu2+-exporting ATPase
MATSEGHETEHQHSGAGHNCEAHAGEQPMCSCDHNPGGECHCPPNECKCDQKHHLAGETQHGHNCCENGLPHDHIDGESHDHGHHDEAGHDHGHHDEAGHDHSHHDPRIFKRQFWFALALTIPTVIWSSMTQKVFGYSAPSFPFSNLIPAAVGTLLLFTGGRVFLRSGLQELKSKRPGMMALISLALVVAFGYSAFLTVAQLLNLTILGMAFMGMDFWWELAALITIMLLGHWLEMSSVAKAQSAVGELAKLVPDFAIKLDGKIERRIAVSELALGDLIVVKPGSVIPADGIVLFGESNVNESMLTGESNPVAKKWGDQVIGGTMNAVSAKLGLGELTIRVTALGEASVIGTIGKLVAQAQASKSTTQRLADKAAGWLFYAALGSAALTAILWPLLGHAPVDFVLERVVTVLVIACPHALGLAIPLVTAITTAKAANTGILIRDRVAFEATRKVDVVLFDKTGTLTTGERGVTSMHITRRGALESIDELLAVAAGLEKGSEHSIAQAILAEAASRKIEPLDVKDVMTTPGVGVSGRFAEYRLFAGGPALLTKNRIDIDVQDLVAADGANSSGNTVIYVVRDATLLGFIALGDQLRETSEDAVYQLQRLGKRVAMLTGDAHGVANSVAAKLGIDEVYAEVLPHQKAEVVATLQAGGATVAMVGDGVNDAPALAQANVGIAIGTGTNVAVESAGVVLLSDDPLAVVGAITLAKRSYAKMVQNLWWGAGYNILAIPLAAGALAPIGLVLSPAVGAVLMSVSTIVVAANAQLLRKDK